MHFFAPLITGMLIAFQAATVFQTVNAQVVQGDPIEVASIFDNFPGFPGAPISCPTDAKPCADGSIVYRDPRDNCTFYECPEVSSFCGNHVCEEGEADSCSVPERWCDKARFIDEGTCPSDCNGSEEAPEGQQCAYYIRDNTLLPYCTVCGDGICEDIEQCTSSSCSGSVCTDDCGDLHCKKDCEPGYSEPPTCIGGDAGSCPEPGPSPEPEPEILCVEVRRDNQYKDLCAPCGDGICDEVEQCVPTRCFRDFCFRDCVSTECPQDCAF